MDVTKSLVRDPSEVPDAKTPELEVVVTAWRPDKLKDMTYTQFWQLISERQIDRVRGAVCRGFTPKELRSARRRGSTALL